MGAELASEATDVTKSCNPPSLHPTPPHQAPSCITAGSANRLASPWRTPRSAVSEWTKWLITPPLRCVSVIVRVCDRWRQVQRLTRCSIRCCWGQRLLPSAGLKHELWTISCRTISAPWLITLRVHYRVCSPLLGCRRMMNHMEEQMEHCMKLSPIKGIFLQRANVTGG